MAEGGFTEKVEKIKMPIRIAILVGTLVLLAGLFFFLVYQPRAATIDVLEKDIAKLDTDLRKARIRAKQLAKFEAEEAQVEAQFKEALKLLPNEKEIPSLLKGITQLGSDSNLTFRLFKPKREIPEGFYYKLPVSMEVIGNYHDVAVFFDKVGRMKRIVNIVDVSMKPEKERSTVLITSCDAVTYRFREDQEQPKDEKDKNAGKKKKSKRAKKKK
jgi:type IV pilus assembly protein PilO